MLFYVTTNDSKFQAAKTQLKSFGVEIEQRMVEIVEIQSDSIEEIARDKARKAFEKIQCPLLVNDSGWYFFGLNGFPGPFMHYVNEWLSAEDLLQMLNDKPDKRVVLKQVVVYVDEKVEKVFEADLEGVVLEKAATVPGRSSDRVVSFTKDGVSLAEELLQEEHRSKTKIWEEFAEWYLNSCQSPELRNKR